MRPGHVLKQRGLTRRSQWPPSIPRPWRPYSCSEETLLSFGTLLRALKSGRLLMTLHSGKKRRDTGLRYSASDTLRLLIYIFLPSSHRNER